MRAERLKEMMVAAVEHTMATGKRPRLPAGGELLWRWFCDLSATRQRGFSGDEPISNTEIEAYGRLYGWPFRSDHVEAILALDQVYLRHPYSEQQGPEKARHSRAEVLTTAAFDAVIG